jgi:hypothetical protein
MQQQERDNMEDQVVSLAYYIDRARRKGAAAEALKAGGDFRDVLAGHIDVEKVRASWKEMFEDELVSLVDIELTESDYLDMVDQVYRGVKFTEAQRSGAVPAGPAPAVHDYFGKYLATAELRGDSRTGRAVETTMERINKILRNKSVYTARVNGLVAGRVQSGKTRNYIGLMLKAADEGWNVVLVLTSAIRALALQTQQRIQGVLKAVGAGEGWASGELDFLNRTPTAIAGEEAFRNGYFYWGLAMKEGTGLGRVTEWFKKPGQPLKAMRVLIIDDESDNATPNTEVGGDSLLSEDGIVESINTIRSQDAALGAWFDRLLESEWPREGDQTADGELFREICDRLRDTGRTPDQVQGIIVGNPRYRAFLKMEDATIPLVQGYFQKRKGEQSPKKFILLLRSIFNLPRMRSAINRAVCELVGSDPESGHAQGFGFERCAYVGYTATPYANILNEGPQETPLYADFIQALDVPPQYFGADAIFGPARTGVGTRMPIVRVIDPGEEAAILDQLRLGAPWTLVDENLVCKDGARRVEWSSLKEAVAWAFCTAAVRRFRRLSTPEGVASNELKHLWTTALVNIDHRQPVHGTVKTILEMYIRNRCRPENREAFVQECREVWDRETARFTLKDFDRLFNADADESRNYGKIADYPAWESLRRHLLYFMCDQKWQTVVINCTDEGKDGQAQYTQYSEDGSHRVVRYDDDRLWFISGGTTLGRGLTLPGLTVSYFDRVRANTSVDTLTQMGRWFGYRKDYELLPRLWMNGIAIQEIKNIARTEIELFNSIEDNFKQEYSPADPAHYQQITYWGRQLSGRAHAMQGVSAVIGATGSADDYHADEEHRKSVFRTSSNFIQSLGPQTARSADEYLHADVPLWENVRRSEVQRFLEALLPDQPEDSARKLRGLLRDMTESDGELHWDVVVGHPTRDLAGEVAFGGLQVRCGAPAAQEREGGILRVQTARLHRSFYAMVPTRFINKANVEVLSKWQGTIAAALDARRVQNGGRLPAHYDAVLPGNAGEPVAERLRALVERLEAADGAEAVPARIHDHFDEVSPGFRIGSSAEYMGNVHRLAGHKRPVLQLYLIRPRGSAPDATPLVNVSFYWPDHDPDTFHAVAVDGSAYFGRPVDEATFFHAVENFLRDYNYPMSGAALKKLVVGHFAGRCPEGYFDAAIRNPLHGYHFHSFRLLGGTKDVYCIDGWGDGDDTSDEGLLREELVQTAVAILDRTPHALGKEELRARVFAEKPKLQGLFSDAQYRHVMTDQVFADEGIHVSGDRVSATGDGQ